MSIAPLSRLHSPLPRLASIIYGTTETQHIVSLYVFSYDEFSVYYSKLFHFKTGILYETASFTFYFFQFNEINNNKTERRKKIYRKRKKREVAIKTNIESQTLWNRLIYLCFRFCICFYTQCVFEGISLLISRTPLISIYPK